MPVPDNQYRSVVVIGGPAGVIADTAQRVLPRLHLRMLEKVCRGDLS